MTRPLLATIFGAFLIFSFGCNKSNDSGPAKGGSAKPTSTLKELVKTDLKVGTGTEVKTGDMAFVIYTGKLTNGTVFDSNDKPDSNPYGFKIGAQSVIKGWDQGVIGMKVGGTRRLQIPPTLGYGAGEAPGGKIPPNSDLDFEIKLIDAVPAGEENYCDKTDIKVGTGAVAAAGKTVTVHYKGTLVNGRRFDSTYERKKPESFKLGASEVISGLDFGVTGMRVGGKRKIRIPPNIGFGEYGFNMVPGNQIVIFEVELLAVKG